MQESEARQRPVVWQTLGETLLADCRVFHVYRRRCHHQIRNVEAEFSIIRSPDWVMGVPLTEDGRIVLVNQFRYGSESFSWEVPGGVIEHDEDPVHASERELREETGYIPARSRLLASCSPNPAVQSNRAHFVLHEGCRLSSATQWDTHEELEIQLVSLEETLDMVRAGTIHHALAIAALFHLQAHLRA